MPSRLRPVLRRLRLPLAALLVLAVALAWWLAGRSPLGYPEGTYGFATGTHGGVYDLYGSLFQPVVESEVPGVKLRLDASAGGPDNLARIATGRDAFGVATADAVAAYTGPGKDRLQSLGRLYDDYVQLVVPTESDIRSVADLRGKRVGTGQANSGVALIASRVFQVSGLRPGHDVTSVPLGIKDAPGELRAGHIDAFFWSGGLPTFNVAALSENMRIRLIPLGGLASAMDSLAQAEDAGARGTQLYRTSSVPASAYPLTAPVQAVPTLAVANLMVTRDDVPTALVERVTAAIISSRDTIGRRVHSAQLVDIRSAIYTDPLPLAEGARRYYAAAKP